VISRRAAGIRVVLLDVEGTTTPMTFVHDVLFPYARARVRSYLEEHLTTDRELVEAARELRDEHARDVAAAQLPASGSQLPAQNQELEAGGWKLEALGRYVHWLMDHDRKSHGLKVLQGKIWERGYATGELKGEVYPDVRPALERWTRAGIGIGIFSSGSVLAQKLLFANSTVGDLTTFLRWYFDTTVGPKVEAASYSRIVDALRTPAEHMLFISDVVKELDAARQAGLQTIQCVRPPMAPPEPGSCQAIDSFEQLDI
jgi:enolase-phosphatase E1